MKTSKNVERTVILNIYSLLVKVMSRTFDLGSSFKSGAAHLVLKDDLVITKDEASVQAAIDWLDSAAEVTGDYASMRKMQDVMRNELVTPEIPTSKEDIDALDSIDWYSAVCLCNDDYELAFTACLAEATKLVGYTDATKAYEIMIKDLNNNLKPFYDYLQTK